MTIVDTPIIPQANPWGEPWTHKLSSEPQVLLGNNQSFLDSVIGGSPERYLYASLDSLHSVHLYGTTDQGKKYDDAKFKQLTVSLAVQAMHQAYAAHVPFSMRPDTFWYMIVHEVAEHVRQNPGKYATLFTDTPEARQTIRVSHPSGGWPNMLKAMRPALLKQARIGDGIMDLFLSPFSTSTIEDETALLVAFMDVVSPYYGTEWRILCGIPQIRLEGDASDWQALYGRTEQLASKFSGLNGYFADLLPVLQKIAETAAGATPDEQFWRSIYQYDGGCGEPTVGGWITAFFAHLLYGDGPKLRRSFDWSDHRTGFYTDKFPSHISKVPFVLDKNGAMRSAAFVAGVTGVDYDGTFLSPRLGFAVADLGAAA